MLSLCTSIPIFFLSFNMRVLLSVGVDANDQNLLQRGALLYCVVLSECGFMPLTRADPNIPIISFTCDYLTILFWVCSCGKFVVSRVGSTYYAQPSGSNPEFRFVEGYVMKKNI